ncbi:hypothetical protein SAMN05428945_2555 [Streptomyces sp. 2224.1]|nr:hypothetical protein SAMN05428945_2555 [Streptomyces sp. 2224.1]
MAQATASANDLGRARFRFRAPDPAGSPRPCSGQDDVGTSDRGGPLLARTAVARVTSPGEVRDRVPGGTVGQLSGVC